MKRTLLLFLTICLTGNSLLNAIEFSVKDKSIIYTNAIKVLDSYQTIINQIGEYVVNDIDKAKSDAEGFLELFVNRQVMLYNDLDPSHKLSQFYEAETYTSNIILWYPDGLSVKLDLQNAKVSDIMDHGDNVYSIDILVKKTIDGNYLNQTLNKNVEELTFRVAFGLENKTLTNFRIVGIRNAASNVVVDYSQALKQVNSEEFSAEDMAKIQTEIKTLFKDYTNFLSLLGDPQEAAEDKEFYKSSFLNLFHSNDILIYNDITPDPQTNLIQVTDYLNQYRADYPNGIRNVSLNSDSARFGKVMKESEGSFYTYVDANKFFSGSYKGKDAYRKMFPLIFKIGFSASGKTFNSFTISSIDISAVDFYEAAPGTETQQKPEIVIRPVTRKGFGMSLTASFGQKSINSKNITSLSLIRDLHSWDVTPLYGYLTAIGVNYFFTDNLGVKTGLEFEKYSAKFSLSGKFESNVLSADINGETYYKNIQASYDSLVKVNYLTVPLLVNYTSGKPGKFGFYAEGGMKVSIPVKTHYAVTGDYQYFGVYPARPIASQTVTDNAYGFYERKSIDETGKLNLNRFNFSLYGSAGINIPLGYYSSVTFGPELIVGLSDIMKSKKNYIDIFGKVFEHEPVRIRNFGFRICLSYKL